MSAPDLYGLIAYNFGIKRVALRLHELLEGNSIYGLLYEKHIASVMKEYAVKPRDVRIEVTNACNAKCVFCYHRYMKRKLGYMNWNLYKKVIDECVELGVGHLSLHNFGEPLLDPLFLSRVVYAKLRNIERVSTNTNGLLLHKDLAGRLIGAGLDIITISIDAATKATFERIKELDYETVERNVKSLVKLKNERGVKTPTVIVSFIECEENKVERKQFVKKWKNIADRILVSSSHNWGGRIGLTTTIRKAIPCRLLWTDFVVDWNGNVPLCCADVEEQIVLGNVKESSVRQIRAGEILKDIRKIHLEGKLDDIETCKSCNVSNIWWLF